MNDRIDCPICYRVPRNFTSGPDNIIVDCYHCGKYSISSRAAATIGNIINDQRDVVNIANWVIEKPNILINDSMITNKVIVAKDLDPFVLNKKIKCLLTIQLNKLYSPAVSSRLTVFKL